MIASLVDQKERSSRDATLISAFVLVFRNAESEPADAVESENPKRHVVLR